MLSHWMARDQFTKGATMKTAHEPIVLGPGGGRRSILRPGGADGVSGGGAPRAWHIGHLRLHSPRGGPWVPQSWTGTSEDAGADLACAWSAPGEGVGRTAGSRWSSRSRADPSDLCSKPL